MKLKIKFLLLFPLFLYAHPHTFIDLYPIVISENNIIKSIKFKWEMDDISSQLLRMECDLNMDGKIDDNENKYIEKNFFEPLTVYDFYTDIMIENKSIQTKPKDFKAFFIGNKMVYSFVVDINASKDDLYIDFYDTDNFVAIVLKKEFVISLVDYSIKGIDNDFYFAHRLSFKKEKEFE
ncbi:MAG: DUF1007 family protein [Arcobacteraceae bacterium]|nr:DUF1007 family protein [Arcobacteraceae bacterium]